MAGKTAVLLLTLLAACGTAHRRQARTSHPEPGLRQFQRYCAACHQYDGQGMGDAPPLAGSPWVTGPEHRLIKIVMHGVRGPMQVSGVDYDLEMPGFGAVLNDSEIASLLSFVRARFGGEPVTASAVNRVRAANPTRSDYWNTADLLKEP
jgi:mono/diheme cytochrome c family protein